MNQTDKSAELYFPPPESLGGWRYLDSPQDVRALGGFDPQVLDDLLTEQQFLYGDSYAIAIIRHGYLVKEYYTFNVLPHTRFDLWSCTKTLTGTAWGLLFDDFQTGTIHSDKGPITLDSLVYDYIPEGWPLTDPRKAAIQFRHLLSMTSGIMGENRGVLGLPTATNTGPFEHALGMFPNRYGKWANHLQAEPGMVFDYSDAAFAHLTLAFNHISGVELEEFMQARVFKLVGIEKMSWDVQGGSGFLGPHTNPHTGAHFSARELARFGYLALHQGAWAGQQILPRWWQELATKSSQELEPGYGFTWWVNTRGDHWRGMPKDMFAMSGFRSNRCYVVPSRDLVVVRLGTGPSTWAENDLIGGVLQAMID
jgi:CubicO group peptidase (beta-lactamase class C family)